MIGYAPAILVPRIVSLAAVLLFTRWLTPAEFGLYALIIVYGEALDSMMLNWSRLGVQRFYHESGVDLGDLVRKSFIMTSVGLVFGGLAAFALANSSATSNSIYFYWILLLYIVGVGLSRFALNILRAQGRVAIYVALEVSRSLTGFFVGIVVLQSSASFAAVSSGMFGITAVFGLIATVAILRQRHAVTPRLTDMRAFIRYSAPLVVVFILSQIVSASDRFAVGMYGGAAMVGIYAASASLARAPIETFFNVLNTSKFPQLVKAYENGGREPATLEMQALLTVIVAIGLPMLVGIWVLATPLSELLLDKNYWANAEWIMRFTALGAFLAGLKTFYSDQVFHLHRKSIAQTATLLPGGVVAIGCCILFVPIYGGIGAAVAMVLGYSVSTMLSFVLATRLMRLSMSGGTFRGVVISSAAMGVFALVLQAGAPPFRVIFTVPICALLYALMCWRFGVHHRFKAGVT